MPAVSFLPPAPPPPPAQQQQQQQPPAPSSTAARLLEDISRSCAANEASERLQASLARLSAQLSASAARAERAREASAARALASEEAARARHSEVMRALSELSSRVEGIERGAAERAERLLAG